MCQVQASLTELSLSSALYVVTKPVLVNDVLMLKNKQKKQRKGNSISICVFLNQISSVSLHLNTDIFHVRHTLESH